MKKTILITGATDGIGLATAKLLSEQGHHLLIHGRNEEKLHQVKAMLSEIPNAGEVNTFVADLSILPDVIALADNIKAKYDDIDVLINNAGVFKTNKTLTESGLDVRFVVNTIAPYLLTQQVRDLLGQTGRVVNLSSAAQAPVNIDALEGKVRLDEMDAYAQSKLGITMWTRVLAKKWGDTGPTLIAVNPGSLLASKMVKEGFGVAGADIKIGAKILASLSTEADFLNDSDQYFDNDSGKFSSPHIDGTDDEKCEAVSSIVDSISRKLAC